MVRLFDGDLTITFTITITTTRRKRNAKLVQSILNGSRR